MSLYNTKISNIYLMHIEIYIINFMTINFDLIITLFTYINFYEIYYFYLKFIYKKNTLLDQN